VFAFPFPKIPNWDITAIDLYKSHWNVLILHIVYMPGIIVESYSCQPKPKRKSMESLKSTETSTHKKSLNIMHKAFIGNNQML
jgi:hypothetical protein